MTMVFSGGIAAFFLAGFFVTLGVLCAIGLSFIVGGLIVMWIF